MANQTDYQAQLEVAKKEIESLKQELARSKRLYLNLFENVGDSIFVVDFESYRIIDCNNHALRRFGYPLEELTKLTLDDIEIPQTTDDIDLLAWQSQSSGTHLYECYYRHKDGTPIHVEVSSRLLDVDNRQVLLNLVRNIETRKKLQQQEFDLALEKERVQLLSEFIQDAGHEFKTPLSIISTMVYLMARSDDQDARLSRAEDVYQQINRVTDFVELLLQMSRIESGGVTVEQVSRIQPILMPICDQFKMKRDNPDDINVTIPERLPSIKADVKYLAEAFSQIIKNAHQATPSGKQITVTAGADNKQVWVEIRDAGDGIPEQDLPHVFKLFWRQDTAHTLSGFGLGLPMARDIVKAHQGDIILSSEVGVGTVVRVSLPIVTV